MKRILVVSNVYPPHVVGGAEVVAHRQVKELKSAGYEVVVFAGRYAQDGDIEGALSTEIYDGVLIYRLVNPAPSEPSWNFYRAADGRRFASLLGSYRPDIVHFHNVIGLGANLIPVARSAGCLVVVTLHDYWGLCFKNTLIRNDGALCDNVEECAACLSSVTVSGDQSVPIRLRRDFVAWCLNAADIIVSPSAYLLDRIQSSRLINPPIVRISNGIPARADRDTILTEGVVQFSCFSYLGEHKGIPTIVRAAELLAEDVSLKGRWRLTFAGGGHLAGWLATTLAQEQLAGVADYVGKLPHSEAQVLQDSSHVILLASEWPENEPVTLLEAIQFGKAQIASRIGGNCDLVDEGRSGLTFDPGDAKGLADTMRRFIDMPELAAEFGRYNARRREQFAERGTITRLAAIYDDPGSKTPLTRDDAIVICVGKMPSPAFANRMNLLLARIHRAEDLPGRLRFIWHEWATSEVWASARMVWVWSDDNENLWLVRRSLRAGIPCLVPAATTLNALGDGAAGIITYDTLLEAFGYVTALQDISPDDVIVDGQGEAHIITALSPPASFSHTLPR